MFKSVTELCAGLIGCFVFLASATEANAHHRRGHGCVNCGPLPPSYTYRTRTVHTHVTRYHDVERVQYVRRVQPIVHVTRVQPLVHVHNVTRVHTRVVGLPYPTYHHLTAALPIQYTLSNSFVYLPSQCGCGY
jgi:hypothetical protein